MTETMPEPHDAQATHDARPAGRPRARLTHSLGGVAVVLALCALPARGQSVSLAPQILYALTSIDALPSKADLVSVLASPSNELALLTEYAHGSSYDFGMRLRAISTIPHFCSQQPAECHAAIIAVLDGIDVEPGSAGQKLLRKRAAIEALGAARSGAPGDVQRLVGFLSDGSRDIRVAAARALRDLCDPAAIAPLQQRRATEHVDQVRFAIVEALAILAQCGP